MNSVFLFKELLRKIQRRLYSYWLSLCAWVDYQRYAWNLSSFRRIEKSLPPPSKETLLIVSGRGMDIVWAQTWTVLSLAIRKHGYRGVVLTNRSNAHINRYYKLLNLELIYYDDIAKMFPVTLPEELAAQIDRAQNIPDYRRITDKGMALGDSALSSYTRYHGTAVVDLKDPAVRAALKEWVAYLYQATMVAEYVYKTYDVKHLFFTEFFVEEYGSFYRVAQQRNLNVIKFTGTIRDDAYLLHHLTRDNENLHHAALQPSSWEKIRNLPVTPKIESALTQNFNDRYGGQKWHRALRNHRNTKVMSVPAARELLGVSPGRKIAVIYSHILYDNLFTFGTDLFNDYAEWFIETVRAACQNAALEWFVKVHPSNIWRGELDTLLKGRYEEERLISLKIGRLPDHVHIIAADHILNPYTWFQLADYGITVRGTSGLEMAALGKRVVVAGTGRYEGKGFTLDPKDQKEYLSILKNLHNIPLLSPEDAALAKRYAYALFVLRPFTVTSLTPRIKTGAKRVAASDDLTYAPRKFPGKELPSDLREFSEWAFDRSNVEFVSAWGKE